MCFNIESMTCYLRLYLKINKKSNKILTIVRAYEILLR
jgi:hypothetical protein